MVLRLTIVSLRNPILNASPLGKIGNLCPIFIRICIGTKSTARSETGGSSVGQAFRTTVMLIHDDCNDQRRKEDEEKEEC